MKRAACFFGVVWSIGALAQEAPSVEQCWALVAAAARMEQKVVWRGLSPEAWRAVERNPERRQIEALMGRALMGSLSGEMSLTEAEGRALQNQMKEEMARLQTHLGGLGAASLCEATVFAK